MTKLCPAEPVEAEPKQFRFLLTSLALLKKQMLSPKIMDTNAIIF